VNEVREAWERALDSQPASPLWVVAGVGLVAALLVFVPVAWRVTEYMVTLAHETGHGLVAALTGQEVSAVHLRSDRSGTVEWMGKVRGPAGIAVGAAGYTGPTLFGLGAAALLAADHPVGLLWVIVILLCLVVIHVRTWFGFLIIPVAVGTILCISWLLPVQVQSAFAHLVAWFLLFGAARDVLQLWSRSPDQIGDINKLTRLTGLPGALWIGIFSAVSVGAIPLGAYWMLARP
jgi:hypothetical protein